MGYKSDIRIITSKDGFEKLKEYVKNYLEENKREDRNLLEKCHISKQGKNQCYFGWNWIKWYENDYVEVDAIMEGLNKLEENDYSYKYMRIGEDKEDYDEQYHFSNRESEPNLEYPCLIREFDDEYVYNSIKNEKTNELEEHKEETDIEFI